MEVLNVHARRSTPIRRTHIRSPAIHSRRRRCFGWLTREKYQNDVTRKLVRLKRKYIFFFQILRYRRRW